MKSSTISASQTQAWEFRKNISTVCSNGFNVYQKTGEYRYADAAADVYHFILDKMVDTRPGSEWFWQTDKYGTPAHKPIVEP